MGDVAREKSKLSGIHLRVFGQTDVGQVREHNEDNFLIANLDADGPQFDSDEPFELSERGAVFGVCDGMGGAAAGEVASQLAVDRIHEVLAGDIPPQGRHDLAARLVRAVQEAGRLIFTDARADRSRRGMGTTSTIATLVDDRLFLAQVGDSRAYILRDEELVQVTRDQSLVNQLIEAGQLTEEEAETFEHNNIILQALGTSDAVQVDVTYVDLRADDVLIICSDGLSGMIRSEDIRGIAVELEDPKPVCARLIESANEAGGHDNITVVVVKFTGPRLPPLDEGEEPLSYRKYNFSEDEEEGVDGGDPIASRDTARLPPLSSRGLPASEPSPDDHGPPSSRGDAISSAEDSVAVPMDGLAPSTVGAIIVAGVTVIIVMGFLLLR